MAGTDNFSLVPGLAVLALLLTIQRYVLAARVAREAAAGQIPASGPHVPPVTGLPR